MSRRIVSGAEWLATRQAHLKNAQALTRLRDLLAAERRWVSSYGNDFKYNFHVAFSQEQLAQGKVYDTNGLVDGFDELPGRSVFYQDASGLFHTPSSFARGSGNEEVIGALIYLGITPKDRNAQEIIDWVERHDEYEPTDPSRSGQKPGAGAAIAAN
jgi:predicted dithiol-disulfide oxidoreductase (DUF899 family)